MEQRFLDASKDRSDAELTDARDRLRREVGARRRTRRLAVGLAAVLVVALVATVLAVGAQRAAERSSDIAERESLVADANRLAALSKTAVGLDLSYLLAAQAFRLEDTPETWDALLAALVEHRRVDLVAPFTGDVRSAELTDAGRTLVIGAGLQLVSWDIGSAEPPGTRLVFPTEEPWAGFRGGNASPTEDRTVHVGAGPDGPWVRLVDEEGDFELLPSSAQLGGVPFGVAFTPDGNLLDVFVEAPSDGGVAASPWRLVQIDPSGGPPRDTGIAATLPLPEPDLTADISEDVSVAVVWGQGDPTQATLVDLTTGRQVTGDAAAA